MTKFRKSLLIFGILVLIIGAALGTFVVLAVTDSLKAERIALEFTVDDAQKLYDGEPLTASSCKITAGQLIEGHTPVVIYKGEQTDVGIGRSDLEVKIVDEDGYDVTGQYKIKVTKGILQVDYGNMLRIEVVPKVALDSADGVIYDGTAINIGNDYDVMVTGGALAKDHHISFRLKDKYVGTVAGVTLTGEDIDVMILDSNGRDVTSNYGSYMLVCRINVNKRPLYISLKSAEKTYDGKYLECPGYEITSMMPAANHRIEVKFVTEDGFDARIKDVGPSLKVTAKVTVYDGDTDVTENYDFHCEDAYLTINKAPLTITGISKVWEYDGEEHSLVNENKAGSVIGLINGETLTVTYSDDSKIKNVSTVKSVISSFSVYSANGGDIASNYDVTCEDGKLEVTKASLTVNLKTLNKEFDGEPFTDEKPYEILSKITGADLQFKTDNYLTEKFSNFKGVANTTYTFALDAFDICIGDEIINDMINITVNPASLIISPRKVELVQDETALSKVYGDDFTFEKGISFNNGLVKSHKIISFTCESASAGSNQQVAVKSLSVVDEQGNNALGCYEITNFSTFSVAVNVSKKEVKAYFDSGLKIEYAANLSATSLLSYIRCDELDAENFDCEFANITTITKLGIYEVNFKVKATSAEFSNYTAINGNNRFEVTRKDSTTTFSKTKNYDTKPVEISDLKLANLNVAGVTNATSYDLVSSNLLGVVDAGTYNAEIVYETANGCERLTLTGTYTINTIKITVSSNKTYEKVYDGKPFEPDVNGFAINSSLGNDKLSVRSYVRNGDIIDVSGEESVQTQKFTSFEIVITSTGETLKLSNVEFNPGDVSVSVKVKRRNLSISLSPLTCSKSAINSLSGQNLTSLIQVSNLVDGDFISYNSVYSAVYVNDDSTMLNKSQLNVVRGGSNVTNNYSLPTEQIMGAIILIDN